MCTLLQAAQEARITLSAKKLARVGYEIEQGGIHVDPGKLNAIADFPLPANLTELGRSFFGLVEQLDRFSKDVAGAKQPLRSLLSTKNPFT